LRAHKVLVVLLAFSSELFEFKADVFEGSTVVPRILHWARINEREVASGANWIEKATVKSELVPCFRLKDTRVSCCPSRSRAFSKSDALHLYDGAHELLV